MTTATLAPAVDPAAALRQAPPARPARALRSVEPRPSGDSRPGDPDPATARAATPDAATAGAAVSDLATARAAVTDPDPYPIPPFESPPQGLPRLRLLPVPIREPYPARRLREVDPRLTVGPAQGVLALAVAQPPADVTASKGEAGDDDQARHEWVVTFVHAAMEVASGMRSPTQLVRWTGLEVQAMLTRRGALAARARAATSPFLRNRPYVRSVRMSSPAEGVWEVAAVIQSDDRVRAVALRLEDQDGRWRVTELEIG
jgi:hypothetical protein